MKHSQLRQRITECYMVSLCEGKHLFDKKKSDCEYKGTCKLELI